MVPLKSDNVWIVQKFPIFETLSAAEKAWLDQHISTKEYQKGERIFSPVKGQNRIFFIRKGIVKISAISEGGRELAMEILGPGDIFGCIPRVESESSIYAEAVEKSVVSSVECDTFANLLTKKTELCNTFVKMLGEKVAKTQKKLEDVVFLDVQGRLAKVLLELAEKTGALKEGSNQAEFSISLTHKDLGGMAATTRETTTAVLNKFKKSGIAEVERGHIKIYDVRRLKNLVVEI